MAKEVPDIAKDLLVAVEAEALVAQMAQTAVQVAHTPAAAVAMVEIMVEAVVAADQLGKITEDLELKELLESFGQVVVVGFHQHA
jgi:hypothetical protein